MFIGFNLKTEKNYQEFYDVGKKLYDDMKKEVQHNLDVYVDKNGSLNGSKMQEDWFPQVNADIFISHSHKDEELAIALAGWLYEKFKLTSFIDSCIWGYSDELLEYIDKNYCLNKDIPTTYNYKKRNFSTSHVHMMLSTALTMMIDKTECIIFLNTLNSVSSPNDGINNKTESPWIYSEVVTTKLVQKKDLSKERLAKIQAKKVFVETAQLNIKYDLELKHLFALNDENLEKWENINANCLNNSKTDNLDELYKLTYM